MRPDKEWEVEATILSLWSTNERRCGMSDLISREALKKEFGYTDEWYKGRTVCAVIDNAPTVVNEYTKGFADGERSGRNFPLTNEEKAILVRQWLPQGEYVDISKLRLMTVEECAGHTIDYAMGWKACIEWIKKGGAE